MEENRNESNGSDKVSDQKNALEWVVFCISLLMVLAVLGYWVYQVYASEASPPDLYVEKKPAPSSFTPFRYHISVHNKGGQTAENAKIEVALERNGAELDKAELEIPFLPKGSMREGWVIFKENPAEADTVVARVVSYKKP